MMVLRRILRPSRQVLLAAWLLWMPRLQAVLPPSIPTLPDYDKRTSVRREMPLVQRASAAGLQTNLPGARVDFHPVTGSAAWVRRANGFLSGPAGQGSAVSVQGAAPGANSHRALRQFLDAHTGLFGHGAEVLDSAQIKEDFVAAHNGLHTVAWEQQLDEIPVFEGLLIAHTTRNGELVSVSSGFLPNHRQAADRATPNRARLENTPTE